MFQPCARQANDFVERCSIDMLSESNRAALEVDARRVATLTRFVMTDSSTHGARARAREICASRQMPDPKSHAFRISPHARSMCRASVVYRRRSSRTDATRTYVSLQTAFRRARSQTLHHPLKRARVASNAPARRESRALLIYLGEHILFGVSYGVNVP